MRKQSHAPTRDTLSLTGLRLKTSHDENEEDQAGPNQTWRVAEEHQKVAEDAETDGLRHAERHKEASEAEHGPTTPAAEPLSHEARE